MMMRWGQSRRAEFGMLHYSLPGEAVTGSIRSNAQPQTRSCFCKGKMSEDQRFPDGALSRQKLIRAESRIPDKIFMRGI